MNKKLNPLRENHLFTKAYRNGVSDVNKLVAVYVMKNIKRNADGSPQATRLGISVNAKLGGAVQRNRVKRIIREGYRACLPKVKPGLIIVVAARGAAFAKSASSAAMARAIDLAFVNLGVYNDSSLKAKAPSGGKDYRKRKSENNCKNTKK